MALQGPEEVGEQVEEPEDLDDQDASSISPAEEITLPPGPGGDEEPEEAFLLPWDRFSSWLHCICVVGFDLELGQAVEVIYPHHSKLSEKEVSQTLLDPVVVKPQHHSCDEKNKHLLPFLP
ncbi:hypothetical protein ATANTOWER_001823 [Ataeniobius toweri]|uniref:Uncharacterized protein n=1 Tax=Ataeniobius toweri TaxID=208326 RepID=A0ABU7BFM8_9TELE|nr:hypothetical protein [Ataeniobius toweri]